MSFRKSFVCLVLIVGCFSPLSFGSGWLIESTDPQSGAALPVDFNGIWEMADINLVQVPEEDVDNLTDLAKQRMEYYKTLRDPSIDDPSFVCLAKGMPWTMLNRARNYSHEIYQTADRVIIFFDLYDAHRNIRLDLDTFPDDLSPSGNGYSIGHWEGSTLVVETRGLTATNRLSHIHRTEDMKVVERWSLQHNDEYGEVLVIDMEIEDPAIFKKTATARMVMKRAPEGTRVGGYNCPDYLWDDHVQSREKEIFGDESASTK